MTKLTLILLLINMTAASVFAKPEMTILENTLGALFKQMGCRFCVERLHLGSDDGTDDPPDSQYVDFEAIHGGTDPVKFIEDRYPGFGVERIEGRPQYYRVYDYRIAQSGAYPLNTKITDFSFAGRQSELIEQLITLNRGISKFEYAIGAMSLYADSSTMTSLSVKVGTVRDALIAGSVFPSDYAILWISKASGTLAEPKVVIGYAGLAPVGE